ncbi:MAG TPA: hypothetical protein VGP12_09075 [Nitrosospira sp.]|nr:hypothetical protein [Nitrosospira sp.]
MNSWLRLGERSYLCSRYYSDIGIRYAEFDRGGRNLDQKPME